MIGVITIKDWADVRGLKKSLIRWAFRGQSSAAWSLESSIERIGRQFGTNMPYLHNREFWILRQFQRRAHILVNSPPAADDKLEWLALIQHYGGPTRLLDFTHSFYVAAFFAMELADSDAAVWGVNLSLIEKKNGPAVGKETIDHANRRYIQMAEHSIEKDEETLGVINVEPDRLNERMSIQKGLFLFPRCIGAPFIDNLAATFDSAAAGAFGKEVELSAKDGAFSDSPYSDTFPPLVKLIIPRNIHYEAIADLEQMNINARTLFPSLEGFARSLTQHLRWVQ